MDNDAAYSLSLEFVKSHYENFPVVSFLLPKDLQKHIAIIYWFARTADDIADEGDFSPHERISRLNEFKDRFSDTLNNTFLTHFDQALKNTINEYDLTPGLFFDLLSAFRQDVDTNRYNTFSEVESYCRRSANTVGRLILQLHGIREEEAMLYSDNICTGLQLTNFYQDLSIDYKKGRIYIPLEELSRFNVSENEFGGSSSSQNLQELLRFNINRNMTLYDQGRKLLKFLPRRLRYEIKWTILGGEEILKKIIRSDYMVLEKRPKLHKLDFIKLLFRSLT
ncbi:MAG: squalene synthase HpnC [Ignavibacteriaceae bacterium]|nr:squalene synthase HpnC [Ignavibacteriaceae bacterium]